MEEEFKNIFPAYSSGYRPSLAEVLVRLQGMQLVPFFPAGLLCFGDNHKINPSMRRYFCDLADACRFVSLVLYKLTDGIHDPANAFLSGFFVLACFAGSFFSVSIALSFLFALLFLNGQLNHQSLFRITQMRRNLYLEGLKILIQ
jgi:hypothetical protein